MSTNIGTLDFEVLVKDDKAKSVLEEVKRRIQDFSHAMEAGGKGMDSAFDSASKAVQKGFDKIGAAMDMNESAIAALKKEYADLGKAAGDALMKGQDKKYLNLTRQMDENKSLTSAHNATLRDLKNVDAELVKYAAHLNEQEAKIKKNADAHVSLRTQIKHVKDEMGALRNEAEKKGQVLDETTGRYAALKNELGRLTDVQGDMQRQAKVLSNDEATFQGVISGLSGLAGAAAAAQGAMSLFAGEDENLQKLLLKVQALTAVTVGLQQVSQSFNKDSEFQLVTVQGIKGWWSKIKEEALGYKTAIAEAAEASEAIGKASESLSDIVDKASESVSEALNTQETEKNTAAKLKNVASESADSAATKINTGATNQNTASQGANTVATGSQAAAAKAGTVANLTLAGAFRAVGLAIKSIPVFGWIAAGISAIVAVVSHFASKAAEAKKASEEFYQAVAEEASEPVAKIQKLSREWELLGDNMKAKERLIKENKKAFDDLGIAINGVAEAEALLGDKARVQAFVDAQIAKAKAAIAYKQNVDEIETLTGYQHKRDQAQKSIDDYNKTKGATTWQTDYEATKKFKKEFDKYDKLAKEQKKLIEKKYDEIIGYEAEAAKKWKETGVRGIEEYAKGTVGALKQALEERRKNLDKLRSDDPKAVKAELDEIKKMEKQLDDLLGKGNKDEARRAKERIRAQKKLNDELLEMMRKNQSDRIALMEEGEKKELALIDDRYNREVEALESQVAKWKKSQGGTLTAPQTAEYDAAYQNIFERRMKAEADFYAERDREATRAWNEYLKAFGTYQEKILATQEVYAAKIAKAKSEGERKMLEAERNVEISALNADMMKKTSLWKKFFGDLEKMSKKAIAQTTQQLSLLIRYGNGEIKELPEDLQAVFASVNDGSEESAAVLKEIAGQLDTVQEASRKLESVNPFKRITQGFKDFRKAQKDSEGQIKALNDIFSGFSEVGGIFTELGKAMEEAGSKAGKVVVTIGEVIGSAVSMASAGASVGGGAWGAIVGAVVGAAAALIPALQGTQGMSEETKHYYESLLEVTDELIEKQLQLVDASNGAAAEMAAANAKLLNEYKKEHLADALEKYLTTWGGGKHSPGHEFHKRLIDYITSNAAIKDEKLYTEAYYALAKKVGARNVKEYEFLSNQIASGNLSITSKFFNVEELEKAGIKIEDILLDVTGTIMSYNAEQLEALKMYAPEIWALLDEETQNYLNGLIEVEKHLEEIERRQKESLTGSTQDEIAGGLDKLFQEADLTFDKIGDSFEEHMKKAILNVVRKNSLAAIEQWYEDFAAAMDDGFLSPEETEALRNRYREIAEDGNSYYENALAAAGIAEDLADDSMSSLSGAIKGASQEEINALTGTMNHLVISQSEATELIRDQLMYLSNIDIKIGISNRYLESIDGKLTAKSDPLRAIGIQ